jgi:hypothetical protein
MFQSGRTEQFGLRGGLSGLGGVVIGFGNGFAAGRPRGGSGLIAFLPYKNYQLNLHQVAPYCAALRT